ncbi:HDOD domain-containing protein [Deltaproteobacteria bacterium]|nr:HDOD domain-containing protein [Deltaproteobacteria bacterium]
MNIYVARQPIFNKDKEIFGYELLFREGMSNFFPGIDGNTATSKVLSNSFFSMGIEKITGNKFAFINFTSDLIKKQVPQLFPKEKLVVELLEDVEPEEKVISACMEISQQGYSIALDDFFYREGMEPLIDLANIIKIDFMAISIEDIAIIIKRLSAFNISLLAEKVETNEQFEIALKMEFKYFQGYFFSKPEIIEGRDISTTQMNLLEMMAEVNKSDFKFQKVEEIIARDVAITYKLMRYINSAYFSRINEISSIKQAIVLLGERGIRNFLSLIAMTKLAEDSPNELVRSSIIRAKFCELVGVNNGSKVNPSELFTLGLFSSIDVILHDTMENLMGKLPLSDSLNKALIHGEGELNDYLRLAICYEKGDWKGVSEFKTKIVKNEEDLPDYFMDALTWADALTSI